MVGTELRVDVHPELVELLTTGHRRLHAAGALTLPVDPASTLGHAVESVGVPLTEVGKLLLDGSAQVPRDRVRAGLLRVLPVTRPQRTATVPARFLLDVHLGSLARLLRVLGLDVAYGVATADDELVRQAAAQQRVLLTQDRALLKRRALPQGAYVRGAGSAAQLDDVLDRFAPSLAPWTRCPACNSLLRPVDAGAVAHLLEPGTRRSYDTFAQCPGCERVYWRGAHSRRLDAVVARAEEVVRSRAGRA